MDLVIDEINVDANLELRRLHGDEVPVGYLGKRKVFKFHMDVHRLRRLLDERNAKP